MEKKSFGFDKRKLIVVGIGMIVIMMGLVLMRGGGWSERGFEGDILSVGGMKVGGVVWFLGFILMIYGIVRKGKEKEERISKE